MRKLVTYLKNPCRIFLLLASRGLFDSMPDEKYIKLMYKARMGRKLDLVHPTAYNEKLNWLKLHDRKPIYTTMVDKLEAKQFIGNKIGMEYIVPVYGAWNSVEEIAWDTLPNQFVIKTNHDSGSVVICRDKNTFDFEKARKILNRSMRHDYYLHAREWPYKNVQHRIFAERFLNMGDALIDYKVMCFNGKPYAIQLNYVSANRHSQDFYDTNWNLLNISQNSYAPVSGVATEKPQELETMLTLSEKLAKDTYCLRVDWFIAEGRLYSGELTLFDGAGFSPFDDYGMDVELGKHIILPTD